MLPGRKLFLATKVSIELASFWAVLSHVDKPETWSSFSTCLGHGLTARVYSPKVCLMFTRLQISDTRPPTLEQVLVSTLNPVRLLEKGEPFPTGFLASTQQDHREFIANAIS